MSLRKAVMLCCAPFALLATSSLAAAMDEARAFAARLAQLRCELVAMQYEARGVPAGTPAHERLAGRLSSRAAEVERELAPARERFLAGRDSLTTEELEELAGTSAAAIARCSGAAEASYRARVEGGMAEPPTPRPGTVAPYARAPREKLLAPEARTPAAIQAQTPR